MELRGGMRVRHVGPELRGLVWADVEVRDALLHDDSWGVLCAGFWGGTVARTRRICWT
jgi:hypothetical protein